MVFATSAMPCWSNKSTKMVPRALQKQLSNQHPNLHRFWNQLGSILGGFWEPSWSQVVTKSLQKSIQKEINKNDHLLDRSWEQFSLIWAPFWEPRWSPKPPILEPRSAQDLPIWRQDRPRTSNLEPRWPQDPPKTPPGSDFEGFWWPFL